MMRDALKTLLIVNASVSLALAIFVEATKLCNQFGVSPWWIAVIYVVSYAAWWHRQCMGAQRV